LVFHLLHKLIKKLHEFSTLR